MAHWLIQIKCKDEDFSLLERFLSSGNISVVREKSKRFVRVDKLTSSIKPIEIKEAAEIIIEMIDGAAKLYSKQFDGISLDVNVYRVKDDGSRQMLGFLTTSVTDYPLTTSLGTDKTLYNWIDVGSCDGAVSKALGLYGTLQHDWRGLYMVLETVEDDIGGQAGLVAEGWISKNKIELFKSTANNYRAIGKDARHATNSFQPPSKPMGITEATKLISSILVNWLKSKSSIEKS